VSAVADASTGALTLSTADGRNITLDAGTATGDGATAVYNATGLSVNAAAPTGHDTFTLAITATFDTTTPGATATTDGDTLVIGGVTYELVDVAGTAAPGNVEIELDDNDANTVVAAALRDAVHAQYLAGNSTVDSSGTGANVILTNPNFGTSGNLASYYTEGTAGGAGAVVESALTAGVDGTYAAGGLTTRGTLTLSSAANFTLGGSALGDAGLAAANPALSALNEVDISTVDGANAALSVLDGALSQVTSIRADLGAVQNRFSSTVANLQATSENLSAARSRILDADFASETASLTRAQILQQAGTAILAQANAIPQNVLSLLR
jgi:flagellin